VQLQMMILNHQVLNAMADIFCTKKSLILPFIFETSIFMGLKLIIQQCFSYLHEFHGKHLGFSIFKTPEDCKLLPEIGLFSKFVHITDSLHNNRSKWAVDAVKKIWLKKEIQNHFVRKNNTKLEHYDNRVFLIKGGSDCEHTRWLTFLSKIEEVLTLKIQDKRISRAHTSKSITLCSTLLGGFDHGRAGATQQRPKQRPPKHTTNRRHRRTSIRSRCKTLLEEDRSNKKLTSPVAHDLKKQKILALKTKNLGILEEEAYDDSMNRMLQERPYEVVSKTPLHWMVRQVKDTLAGIKNKYGVDLKYLQHSNPNKPRTYGLSKFYISGN
jgi:hypothetical protein